MSIAITTDCVRDRWSIFSRTWSIVPRKVWAGQSGKRRLDFLALTQTGHVTFQDFADDPHGRGVNDVVQMIGRLDYLADAHVGVGNHSANRTGDRQPAHRLARSLDLFERFLAEAEAKQFVPGDLQLSDLLRQECLGLQQCLSGDRSLVIEGGTLFDHAPGDGRFGRILEHLGLERLQVHAHHSGEFLARRNGFAGTHKHSFDLAGNQRTDHRLLSPGQLHFGVDAHGAAEVTESDLGRGQSDRLTPLGGDHDLVAHHLDAFGRQWGVVLVRQGIR